MLIRPQTIMFVSAICPITASRSRFVPGIVSTFLDQRYADSELVVVSEDRIDLPAHPRIRFVSCDPGLTLGSKRNFCCAQSRGELICTWDSDDYYGPDYISALVNLRHQSRKPVVGFHRIYFLAEDGSKAWKYIAFRGVTGMTLSFDREWWKQYPYQPLNLGEDSAFQQPALDQDALAVIDGEFRCIAREHNSNTWQRDHVGPAWSETSPGPLLEIINR
jgi:hypothetical protein